MFKKLISVLCLNLLISVPTYATAVDEKDINFLPTVETLMKGKVHIAVGMVTAKRLRQLNPDLLNLDSLGFTRAGEHKVLVAKSAYIVNKPAGFFDHLNTSNEGFVSHLMSNQRVEKVRENEFKVSATGSNQLTYRMKTYFDSDEISTLPNSKVIRAVTQARKLDVISQSASSVIFREFVDINDQTLGGIQVSTYIPLKENKTLVLNYSMSGMKKSNAKRSQLKKKFIEESLTQQRLINSYGPK